MKYFAVLFILAAVYSTSASPTDGGVLPRPRWEVFSNIRVLIEELVANLQGAAGQASTAIQTFEYGLVEQGKLVREKLMTDLQKLREQVDIAIQGVVEKLSAPGAAVMECINESRDKASAVLNETQANAITCTDGRISAISIQIEGLKNLTEESISFANSALVEMHQCIADYSNSFMSLGTCLGSVAMKAEVNGAVLLTRHATSVGKISLSVGTITAALDVCVGREIVTAGMAIGRIIVEIGTCSASSIYNNTSNTTDTI